MLAQRDGDCQLMKIGKDWRWPLVCLKKKLHPLIGEDASLL